MLLAPYHWACTDYLNDLSQNVSQNNGLFPSMPSLIQLPPSSTIRANVAFTSSVAVHRIVAPKLVSSTASSTRRIAIPLQTYESMRRSAGGRRPSRRPTKQRMQRKYAPRLCRDFCVMARSRRPSRGKGRVLCSTRTVCIRRQSLGMSDMVSFQCFIHSYIIGDFTGQSSCAG